MRRLSCDEKATRLVSSTKRRCPDCCGLIGGRLTGFASDIAGARHVLSTVASAIPSVFSGNSALIHTIFSVTNADVTIQVQYANITSNITNKFSGSAIKSSLLYKYTYVIYRQTRYLVHALSKPTQLYHRVSSVTFFSFLATPLIFCTPGTLKYKLGDSPAASW